MKNKTTFTIKWGGNLTTIVTIIFVLCKVTEYGKVGQWSWWWIFSPIWIIPVTIVTVIGIFFVCAFVWMFVSAGVEELYKNYKRKKNTKIVKN